MDQNQEVTMERQAVLERTSNSLIRSQQVAVETETVGTEILSELDEQRQSLLRTRDRLSGANEELVKSRRLINSIQRNVIYNKGLLIMIIILEALILIAIIYRKYL